METQKRQNGYGRKDERMTTMVSENEMVDGIHPDHDSNLRKATLWIAKNAEDLEKNWPEINIRMNGEELNKFRMVFIDCELPPPTNGCSHTNPISLNQDAAKCGSALDSTLKRFKKMVVEFKNKNGMLKIPKLYDLDSKAYENAKG